MDLLAACKGKFVANWFLTPKAVLKDLGIKKRLSQEDWLVLKEFPFATLAYDYEEGLKWEGKFSDLPKLVEFVRKFHRERNIPFSFSRKTVGKYYAFQVSARCGADDSKLRKFALLSNLQENATYKRNFEIPDVEIITTSAVASKAVNKKPAMKKESAIEKLRRLRHGK